MERSLEWLTAEDGRVPLILHARVARVWSPIYAHWGPSLRESVHERERREGRRRNDKAAR